MAEEEAKPEGLSEHINLKVTSQDGNVVHFKAKRGTQFRKLMKAYCERQSFQPESVVFMYDGERLRGDQTPADVDMQDQDSIDVMIHQVGGLHCTALRPAV